MKNKKIVFICLTGKKYGLGNLQRSLKIAKEVYKNNKKLEIEFIVCSKKCEKIIKQKIEPFFSLKIIKKRKKNIKDELIKSKPHLVIADMLSFDTNFLKPRDYKIITLDNYNKGSDIYINILKLSFEHKNLEFNGYQYWAIEKPKRKKENIKEIKNILISCGYTDPKRKTEKLLKYITSYCKTFNKTLCITCIITSLFTKNIEKKLIKLNKNVIIKKDLKNINSEILKADLCFVCGGNTMFEAITLATPCVVLPYCSKNKILAKELESKKYVKSLDNLTEQSIHKFLKELNLNVLNELHQNCLKFDGYGINKITTLINKELIKNEQ